MTLQEKMRGKPSKKPQYAKALELYLCESTPDFIAIAKQTGLRADTLIQVAERQSWDKRRSVITRSQSIDRAKALVETDARLVTAATEHVTRLTEGWRDVVARVLALSVQADDESERSRLLGRKANLMRLTSRGFRELAGVAQDLGLISALPGDKPGGAKPDFARLTQLNITIQQALKENPPPHLDVVADEVEDLIG